MDCNTCKNDVACSLERRWIAKGTRHRPERLAWINVDSHWPFCVDWTCGAFVRAQSLRSWQMNKCHFTIIMSCVQSTLRNIRQIFGQIRLSEKLNNCHFTSLHDYHVVCSIHTSEHSVNFWTNSVFGKIWPSDNCRFRTYDILHCPNQIRIFYNFLVKTCFHHNICHHQIHKKFFKISFLWIVIPAKMIVACSLERTWIAEVTRHTPERQNS